MRVFWDKDNFFWNFRVASREATLADYERAWERVLGLVLRGERCRECAACCSGRIPVTVADVVRLRERVGRGLGLGEWVARYCMVRPLGRTYDVSLRVRGSGECIFLRRGACVVYRWRPFVCRVYGCVPVARGVREVRLRVVNCGQDELVRRLVGEGFLCGGAEFLEGLEPGPFRGRNCFEEVPLREVCTREVWRSVFSSCARRGG